MPLRPNRQRCFWPPRTRWLAILLSPLLALTACDRTATQPPSPASPTGTASAPAPEWFTDITATSGLNFQQQAGTNYAMPDQVASGLVLFDFDNDGRLDVYAVQSGQPGGNARNQLFHQEADGSFRNASTGSGLDVAGRGMGAIAGDLNNDGRPDVVVTEYGAVRIFQNVDGRRFREVTAAAGLINPGWAAPASFIDYDRDGWLDLVVGNYIDYDPTQRCTDSQGRTDFCAPAAFGGTVTRLWRNTTGAPGKPLQLEERTVPAGLTRAPGAALGLVCADFDGDGWPDIFCADDGRPNRLFINRHNGTFTEEAVVRGLAYNHMGATAANMGTAFGDVDGDGLADVFVTHLTEEFHGLWRQGPRGQFLDQVGSSGLQQQAWRGTGFGTVLVDFDADGESDLAFVNGLVRRAMPGQTPVLAGVDPWWARYAQKAQVFRNEGRGRFRDVSPANPALCGTAAVGRSLVAGDLNNDGALDLIVGNIGGPARVLRNTAPDRGHWLRVRLVEPAHGGRDAIGAELTVRAAGRSWWRPAQPALGYLSCQDPTLHIGLGSATTCDGLEVQWADGTRERFPGGAVDRVLTLARGTGQAVHR